MWVAAAQKLGIPVQSHYSGIADAAAGEKFPDWCVVQERKGSDKLDRAKMCPRGPYADKLLIPQAIEMIDRYGVDGIWVDGEIWAVQPCYCQRCCGAFKEQYGIDEPPSDPKDENWLKWIKFTRESFQEYVNHYADEIRRHNPKIRVCSNWMHSFTNPGEPTVRIDFISGDNIGTIPSVNNFCQARFMSTRGRPWEIVLWGFYYNKKSPWVMKPVDMMKQQAASIIALGGNMNIYNQPKGNRDGRLVPWQMKRLGEVGKFVKARKEICQHGQILPQVLVLHSEDALYSQRIRNIWNYDTKSIEGAVYCLLENSFGVDIMDEWASLDRLSDFPLIVATKQANMSQKAVDSLKAYVKNGGRLLLCGVDVYDRFGEGFIGAKSLKVTKDAGYHVPTQQGRFPFSSVSHQGGAWTEQTVLDFRLLKTTTAKNNGYFSMNLFEDSITEYPSVIVNKVGKGAVAYIPFDVFDFYYRSRYPMVREFIREVIDELKPQMDIRVKAPTAVEVVLKQKSGQKIIHLINRSSGLPLFENIYTTDEIPNLGPIIVTVKVDSRPKDVKLLFEDGQLQWDYVPNKNGCKGGKLNAAISSVHIHSALLIK